MTEIKSINELLGMELDIPDYQRPYKWTIQNIEDLLSDISNSITDAEMYRTFKYRIGTIILHKNDNGRYDVVDGQQRIISLTLLKHCIEPDYTCSMGVNYSPLITRLKELDLFDKRPIEEYLSTFRSGGELA